MADEQQQSSGSKSRSSKSAKNAAQPQSGPTEDGLAPVVGEGNATDDRPAEQKPGTPEHLGSDRPYEGEPSPYITHH